MILSHQVLMVILKNKDEKKGNMDKGGLSKNKKNSRDIITQN